MGNYVDRMLKEGLTFEQFAAVCASAMAVEHGYREVSAFHDQEIAAATERIIDLLRMTDEEAQEKQAARLAELEARRRECWEQTAQVAGMREQVDAWEPGENVDVRGLKRFMLEELDRGPDERLLAIHDAGIAHLKAMTPQEYREGLYQSLRQQIISHQEAKETEAARSAEWRGWREALAASGIQMEPKFDSSTSEG